MEPELIIADEPVSALDVSIQAQVINLLNDLRHELGLTILFIAHDLSVVKYFSDRIGVMYFGKMVELATSDELFAHPLHPYTKALLSAIPLPDPVYEKNRKRITYNPLAATITPWTSLACGRSRPVISSSATTRNLPNISANCRADSPVQPWPMLWLHFSIQPPRVSRSISWVSTKKGWSAC